MAILNLVNENKLKLSDDIRKWFPELYPDTKEKITLLNLLNHTSGIRDCYDLWSLQGHTWWERSLDNNDVLSLMEKQSDLNFTPGTEFLYSNTNYILLALIIEKVSEKTFVEYTNEIFRQLNMPNTSFECDFSRIRGPIARAYFNFGTWTTFDWIWNVCGDGNLFSTLEDQIQWEKLVQGKGETNFNWQTIQLSQQTIENSTFKNYGYGLEFGEYKNMEIKHHEGATGAWKANVIRFAEENLSILAMTNSGKSIPSMQTRQMADVVFDLNSKETYLLTKPKNVGKYLNEDEILGTYLTESDFAFTFEKKNDKVFLKRVGRNDVELEREADNLFHQKYDPDFKLEFTTDSKGQMQVTAYYINHSPYTLIRVGKPKDGFDLQSLNGQYFNAETNTHIFLRHLEGMNYEVTFRSDYKSTGLLVSENKLLVDFYSLEFTDGDLLLNGDRIKQVKYSRK